MWVSCKDRLPGDHVVVETKIDDEKGVRNVARLKRQGRLWFVADGVMYVYYTPTHWREPSPEKLYDADQLDRDLDPPEGK